MNIHVDNINLIAKDPHAPIILYSVLREDPDNTVVTDYDVGELQRQFRRGNLL